MIAVSADGDIMIALQTNKSIYNVYIYVRTSIHTFVHLSVCSSVDILAVRLRRIAIVFITRARTEIWCNRAWKTPFTGDISSHVLATNTHMFIHMRVYANECAIYYD